LARHCGQEPEGRAENGELSMVHNVREAAGHETEAIARSLALAFEDDPVFAHLIPPTRHTRRLQRFFVDDIDTFRRRGRTVLTTDGCDGAALWSPPGDWKMHASDIARSTPAAVKVFGRRLPLALQTLSVVEAKHPEEPHWYLAVLGTAPTAQGNGIGAALLAPILERCDGEGIGAYLESSKPENVPYYERFGFVVHEEVPLPKGGPPVWRMWRDPRPEPRG
jgi:GNAT superfamily N-acetyltransferase